jgi:voltage-gated potassium channel
VVTQPADRLERWEAADEWPLAVAAVVFLIAYAWPILDPQLGSGPRHAFHVINWIVWALFGVDYVIRVALAPRRLHYVLHHLLDLVILALPILRPLRLLRLVTLLEILNRRAEDSLRGRIAIYVAGSTVLLVFCASLAVLDAERGRAGSNINSFGNALWWSATTITTVGYGDHFPVTATGRFVAVGLMIGGVALLGVVTASIASWLIGRVQAVEETSRAVTRADFQALSAELRELKAMIAANASATLPAAEANGVSPPVGGPVHATPDHGG